MNVLRSCLCLNLYASFLASMRIIHESSLASFLSHANENRSKQQEAGWGLGTRVSRLCFGFFSHEHCSLEVTLHCLSWLMTSAHGCLIYMWMSTSKQANMHTHVCNTIMLVWGSLRLIPIVNFITLASEIKMTYLGETETYQWWMLQDSPTPVVLSAHNGRETQKNIQYSNIPQATL